MAQTRRERNCGISIKLRVLGSAGDGDIGEAAIDKVGVDIGVHVHQHAVSSEFLGSLSAKDLTGLLNLA